MKKSFHLLLLALIPMTSYAQQDCETVSRSEQYFSVSATAKTEGAARINALSLLAENISSVVSSRTDLLTKDDRQTFYNASKSTSVLHLKGVTYLTCDKSKKNGVTVLAFISKKDLAQSSAEVAARVSQYLELMEQKEARGIDFLPEAYIAYLNTFMSPYAIEYKSDTRHISNVRGYLESYLRTFLSNVTVACSGVTENPNYPDQQLTLSLALHGTNDTRMKFLVDLPEYGARGYFDQANNTMDVIMTPDGRKTKFSGKLSLAAPPLEADLKDISEQIQISREVSFDADMSNIIKLDFNSREQGSDLLVTPVVRHLAIRQVEWLSEGKLLSIEQKPRISAIGLKELTLRVNASQELVVTKTFIAPAVGNQAERRSEFTSRGPSLNVQPGHASTTLSMTTTPSMTTPLSTTLATPNTSFPEDAIVFVESDVPNLVFRSSMLAIDRQAYNSSANRYEILVKPLKQLLSVEGVGLPEKSMGIINPQPKDAIYYRVSITAAETLISKGLLSISSDPPNASIFINDIETVYHTPFTIMIPDGTTKITLRKRYYQAADTVIHIDSKNAVDLMVKLARVPGTQNIADYEPLSYLQGRRESNFFQEMPLDPVQQLAQDKLRNYQRETLILRRKAVLAYSTAAMGLTIGVCYNWLDRMIYDGSSSHHSSVLGTVGDVSYVVGGVGLVAGIIYSTKLARLKKNWSIQPAPNARGMGVGLTVKF